MTPSRVTAKSGSLSTFGRSALWEGKASISLLWNVFWKVTVATTALFFALLIYLHHNDLRGPFTEAVLGVAVFFGYCLFYASWVGIGAATFAIAWRWCGAWIIIPLVGAVIGAVATVMLAAVILLGLDLPSAGPHGGGHIAALLVIGVYVVSAVIGAIGGGVLSAVPALIVVLSKRRRRQANADIPKLQ